MAGDGCAPEMLFAGQRYEIGELLDDHGWFSLSSAFEIARGKVNPILPTMADQFRIAMFLNGIAHA